MRSTKHNRTLWIGVWLACAVAWLSAATTRASPLREADAVRLASARNPALRAAVLELKRMRASVRAEQARYGYLLRVETIASHDELPIATLGGVVIPSSDALELAVGLQRTLPWGTELELETRGALAQRRLNPIATDAMLIGIGPTYALQLRLLARQPLLRGAGRDVGELALQRARIERTRAEHVRDHEASRLLRDVLTTYWDAWYADAAFRVIHQARDLARQQHEQMLTRMRSGASSRIDVLPFASRVAALQESVVEARVARHEHGARLARLLGQPVGEERDYRPVERKPPEGPPLPTRGEAVRAALQQSPELERLRSEAELARTEIAIAKDAAEPRLDLQGSVGLRGLGDQDAVAPLRDVGRFAAFSAEVSAILELPFDNSRRRQELAAARLAVSRRQSEVQQAEQELCAEVDAWIQRARGAQERIALAKETVDIAAELVTAQQERFEQGTAVPSEILRAQEELRDARLRLRRARVDAAQARFAVAHLTGELLASRHADVLGT